MAEKAKNPSKLLKYIIFLALGILSARGVFLFLENKLNLPNKAYTSSGDKKKNMPQAGQQVSIQEPPKIIPQAQKTAVKNPRPELNLSGFLSNDSGGWAIINDRIVKKGDVISGAEVMGIYADRVELKFEDESFSLSIK